jgi:hypothetical protein
MSIHAPSRTAYAVFLAYFAMTRTVTILDYARRGRWHLVRWTLRGLADFIRGRTGGAAVAPIQARHPAPRPKPAEGPPA